MASASASPEELQVEVPAPAPAEAGGAGSAAAASAEPSADGPPTAAVDFVLVHIDRVLKRKNGEDAMPPVVFKLDDPAALEEWKNEKVELKQGLRQQESFTFRVRSKPLLQFTKTERVFKLGVPLPFTTKTYVMGDFQPREEPHVHVFEPVDVPTGWWARNLAFEMVVVYTCGVGADQRILLRRELSCNIVK